MTMVDVDMTKYDELKAVGLAALELFKDDTVFWLLFAAERSATPLADSLHKDLERKRSQLIALRDAAKQWGDS